MTKTPFFIPSSLPLVSSSLPLILMHDCEYNMKINHIIMSLSQPLSLPLSLHLHLHLPTASPFYFTPSRPLQPLYPPSKLPLIYIHSYLSHPLSPSPPTAPPPLSFPGGCMGPVGRRSVRFEGGDGGTSGGQPSLFVRPY